MSTPLLRTSAKIIIPLQILLSIYLLLRGHNLPGGGFVAGLVAGSAALLFGLSVGFSHLETRLPLSWLTLIRLGLGISVLSGLAALFAGLPFLSAIWGPAVSLPLVGKLKLGTVLLFDIGVYLLVAGFTIGIALHFTRRAEL